MLQDDDAFFESNPFAEQISQENGIVEAKDEKPLQADDSIDIQNENTFVAAVEEEEEDFESNDITIENPIKFEVVSIMK